MNRRLVLIALAVLVPLALFVPAKIAASWRPVKVGHVPNVLGTGPSQMTMRASRRYLLASDAIRTDRFDLRDGGQTVVIHGGIAENDDWLVNLRSSKSGQSELVLRDGSHSFAFPIQGVTAFDEFGYDDETAARVFSRQNLRIHPDRVEFVLQDTFYRWNRASRKLERRIDLRDVSQPVNGFREQKIAAIARDGERVVTLDSQSIEWRNTRGGEVIQRFPLAGYRPSNWTPDQIQVSDYGALALYNARDKGGNNSRKWEVRSTDNGRVLWKFALPSTNNRAVFSPDETRIALPADDLKWQIRDAQTGALIRTLSRVHNMRAAIFSPDGGALYSVAEGVLFRQRAR